MAQNEGKEPTGMGAPIALLIMAGAIIGGLMGQPSLGLLIGLALGVAAAIAMWLRER
ncbi:MAG: hypothetical protein ABW164_08240 [Sphingobium sp.]